MSFNHPAMKLEGDLPLVYTAMSKSLFYYRMHISKFVFDNKKVPLNPFMLHEYFLLDTVDRNLIRKSNNTLVKKADEIWVFGEISDGVLAEILIAKKLNKTVRFFKINKSIRIFEISSKEIIFENDIKDKDKESVFSYNSY
ncbi:MAG: hypothetical protein JXA94_01240 [Parachlamydiales bacterium]|nr:hypothetical protein [Parachlamydiales bacterium]